MKPIYIKVTDRQLLYSHSENQIDEKSFKFDDNLELKQSLQAFKDSLIDLPDVIVITNPCQFILKKNAIKYRGQVIDFGTILEDIFHITVINLDDLADHDLNSAANAETDYSTWHLDYYGLDHGKRQYGQESMQTIGNGYLGVRGTYLEAKANDDNYPATYVAGVFNQLSTPINSRDVINEDLVNLPNAQYISFSVDDGREFKIDSELIEESNRSLDLKTGQLTITMLIKLTDGKKLKVTEKKVADMKNYHDYYFKYAPPRTPGSH